MKTLFLVRHAKASRDDPLLPDRKRPLTDRGRRDAKRMGERLAKRGVEPDRIVSSPATRALATAEIMAGELGYKRKDIVVDDRLYAATQAQLLEVVRELPDEETCVMLYGHNPELAVFAHQLSGDTGDLPTCAVVELGYDVESWSGIGTNAPISVSLRTPKSDSGDT